MYIHSNIVQIVTDIEVIAYMYNPIYIYFYNIHSIKLSTTHITLFDVLDISQTNSQTTANAVYLLDIFNIHIPLCVNCILQWRPPTIAASSSSSGRTTVVAADRQRSHYR